MNTSNIIKVKFFIDGISFAHISNCYYLNDVSLHGHNTEIFLEAMGDTSFSFEELLFSLKKEILRAVNILEHKTIFPQDSLVKIKKNTYFFDVFGESYILPKSDVLLLPGNNVSLSKIVSYFGFSFKKQLSNELLEKIKLLHSLSLIFSFENNVSIEYFFI